MDKENINAFADKKSTCENCALNNTLRQQEYDNDILDLFLKNKKPLFLKKGDILFNKGEKCQHIYCIKEGMIRMVKEHEGSLLTIWLALKGELLGIQSFMSEKKYKFSAIAMSDCEVCEIPVSTFTKLLEKQGSLYLLIMKIISKRVNFIERKLSSMSNI